ncbi:hypothetical protein GCM10025857_32740 [Alicyclobacillus contaminans]|uniref:LysM peptidoglycan-binding domain-containing protein n=1 Tax=Alicyclobacillus contaminans TaxID=392016 RepID=UPI000420D35B|nr:LysM peptidoglycan-binding domain-containing protein [Alicyclobacillus contaminans]GMA51917.1 hypothetical protein GCM10025857_32740 [Alicyclobacillus contaminans]
MKKYIVREGDTMWSISKATGVRMNLLLAANPQISDPNRLSPGTVLVIPELHKKAQPAGTKAPTAPSEQVPPYFGFVWPHVVKAGETWASIARRYQTTVGQLKDLNPGYGDTPQPGQIVYVPGVAHPGTTAGGAGWTPQEGYPAPPMGEYPQPQGGMPGGYGMAPSAQGMPGQMMPDEMMPAPQEAAAMEPYPAEPGPLGPHTHYPYRGADVPHPMPGTTVVKPMAAGYWAFIPYHPQMFGLPMGTTAKGMPMESPSDWNGMWADDDSSSWAVEAPESWRAWRTPHEETRRHLALPNQTEGNANGDSDESGAAERSAD